MWMTGLVVTAVTIYAWNTKSDFTYCWPIMLTIVIGLMILGIVSWLVPFTPEYELYFLCPFGAMFYSIYLVIDIQMLVGGKRY